MKLIKSYMQYNIKGNDINSVDFRNLDFNKKSGINTALNVIIPESEKLPNRTLAKREPNNDNIKIDDINISFIDTITPFYS